MIKLRTQQGRITFSDANLRYSSKIAVIDHWCVLRRHATRQPVRNCHHTRCFKCSQRAKGIIQSNRVSGTHHSLIAVDQNRLLTICRPVAFSSHAQDRRTECSTHCCFKLVAIETGERFLPHRSSARLLSGSAGPCSPRSKTVCTRCYVPSQTGAALVSKASLGTDRCRTTSIRELQLLWCGLTRWSGFLARREIQSAWDWDTRRDRCQGRPLRS